MPNLEPFLAQWRPTMSAAHHMTPEMLDELERHIRDRVAQLVGSGFSEVDACQRAAAELGNPETIAAEFRKLDPGPWLPVRIMTASGVALALAVAILVLVRPFTGPGAGMLLAVHVFAITLGYGTALLLGVLGACFVIQRARAGFSSRRLASLTRATFAFATIATVCTVVGTVLAMFWAHREWGRFWDWDPKEIGAFCVVVWMSGFLIAHWFRWVTARGLLVASLIGSNVVFLGWFAPEFPQGLQAYGFPNTAWLLLAALILNCLLTILGLAPAGCLRSRKV
jgi:hypothetical protein